jgi:hypothetical protein
MPSRPRRSSSSAATLAALVLAAPRAFAEALRTAPGPRALAQRVLADPRYQKRFTELAAHDRHTDFSFGAGPLGNVLSIVALTTVVLLFGVWVAAVLQRRQGADAAGPAGAGEGARPAGAAASLQLAQSLAEAGRFTEAVHALLFVALQNVATQAGVSASPARTSREIVRDLPQPLARERGAALGELVRHVEISVFGGRPLGADDYARCVGFCRAALGERA